MSPKIIIPTRRLDLVHLKQKSFRIVPISPSSSDMIHNRRYSLSRFPSLVLPLARFSLLPLAVRAADPEAHGTFLEN